MVSLNATGNHTKISIHPLTHSWSLHLLLPKFLVISSRLFSRQMTFCSTPLRKTRQSEGTTTNSQTAHIHCQGSTCTHDYLSPCAHRQLPVLLPKANSSTWDSILALPSLKDSILAILLSLLYVIKLPSLKICCSLPLLCSKEQVSAFTPLFFSLSLVNPLQQGFQPFTCTSPGY